MDSGDQTPLPPKKSRFKPNPKAARNPPKRQADADDGQSQESKKLKSEGAKAGSSANNSNQGSFTVNPIEEDSDDETTLYSWSPSDGEPMKLIARNITFDQDGNYIPITLPSKRRSSSAEGRQPEMDQDVEIDTKEQNVGKVEKKMNITPDSSKQKK